MNLYFRHLILTLMGLLVFQVMTAQNTYYISNGGNDGANGLSAATAWQTITKLNTVSLNAGDKVFFERGGTFVGTIEVNSSGEANNPIIFDAYGTGEAPIISGAQTLTLNTSATPNIYEANTSNTIKDVHINSQKLFFARMPNTGFYTIASNTATSMTDNVNLNTANGYYNGANTRMRTTAWSFEAREITSSSGGTLNFSGELEYQDIVGWGYFLDNHIDFLDNENEFYYDSGTQRLMLYSNTNLNGTTITASYLDYGITTAINVSHIEVHNLHFMHQVINSLDFEGTVAGITVTNCTFDYIGETAIRMGGTYDDVTITDNQFNNIYGIGIQCSDLSNAEIANNTFKDIGMYQGYGIAFSDVPINNYAAIAIVGHTAHVHHNRTENTGFGSIRVDGDNNLVEKNYVKNALLTMTDSGGIYCWGDYTNNSIFQHNIIEGVFSNTDGMPDDKGVIAVGIYLDNDSNNMTVQYNTVLNTPWGFFANSGGHSHIIRVNTFYNFETLGAIFYSQPPSRVSYDHAFEDNLLVGFDIDAPMVIKQTDNTVDDFIPGIFARNIYLNPYSDSHFQSKKFGGGNVTRDFSFENWRDLVGSDNTSVTPFWSWNLNRVTDTLSTNLISNSNFDIGTDGWESWTASGGNVALTVAEDALRFENSGSEVGLVYYPNIVFETSWYQLSFEIASTQNGKARMLPKRHFGSFDRFTESRDITFLADTLKRYNLTFNASEIIDPGRLDFELLPEDGSFTLDNVELYQVDTEVIDPTNEVVIFYNDSDDVKNIDLTGNYFDIGGVAFESPLVLEPWTSKVLVISNLTVPLTQLPNPDDAEGIGNLDNINPYNIITPNGDGQNDFWQIDNLSGNYNIKVFTKTGMVVFETDNINIKTWNGMKDGQELPEDIYYYIISFEGLSDVKTGYVTLIR